MSDPNQPPRSHSVTVVSGGVGAARFLRGLMDVIDQGLSGTVYQTLIEWICGLGVFHPKAAARLQGIKNA